MLRPIAAAVFLPLVAQYARGALAEQALELVPAAVGEVLLLDQGDFHELAPDAKLSAWSGGSLRADVATSGTVLEAVKAPESGRAHHVRYASVIRVEIGYTYTVHLEYRTDMEGVGLELHHYAFSTFGDTVAVTRKPLPPVAGGMGAVSFPFSPAPGTISLFPRIVVPETASGTLTLRRFNISGYPWGGQQYGDVAAQAYRDRRWWEVSEAVENSVPVSTQYFGPDAQNVFPVRRGRGSGTPWIPAGAVVPFRRGVYTVGVELRGLGGGASLARYAGTIRSEADAPPAQRILLPVATESCTIAYACWDGRGALVKTGSLRLYVQQPNPFEEAPDWSGVPATRRPWPGGGSIGLAMQTAMVSDYHSDRVTAGTVDVARGPADRSLTIRVLDYLRNAVVDENHVIPGGEGRTRVGFALAVPRPDVYDVTAELREDERCLDKRTLRLGFADARPAKPFVKPNLPDLFLCHEQAFRSPRHAPAADEQFERHLAYVREYGDNTVGIAAYPRDVNPLPGVYRFGDIEARVKMASAAGLTSHVYLVTYMRYWPDWAKREMGLDQDGRPDDLLSIASPGFRDIAARLCGHLARHFRSQPDVVSFGMWGAWCEWSYRDSVERHYDYCPSALALWRQFSSGLEPPQPLDSGPDLRREWRQWAAFRMHTLRRWFVESFGETIRREDPERWLVRYLMAGGQGAMEELYGDFKRLRIYPAHGGSDSSEFRRHAALARQYGLLYRHESVSAPARHPLQVDLAFFHGLFNGLFDGVAPAYNVAWNIGWNVTHQHPGVLRAQERRRELLGLVRWMQANGFRSAPNEWAQYQSWDDMMLGARHFQWHALAAGLYWADNFEHLSYDAVSDRTPPRYWHRYKCVFSYRPRVITAETASRILAYVRGGGTFGLVMFPGPGMAAVTGTAEVPPRLGRVAAVGKAPWLADGRRLVLDECHRFGAPVDGVAIATSEQDNTPLAWHVPEGKGHLLLFAGKPIMPDSKGFLTDILAHVGVRRRFDLVSAEPNDYYPPAALEFIDGKGRALLLVIRGTRWNNWRHLKAKAPATDPTFAGLATVFPRRDVHVTYVPDSPGPYRIERWHGDGWSIVATLTGDRLADRDLKVHVAPAELGILRFTRR